MKSGCTAIATIIRCTVPVDESVCQKFRDAEPLSVEAQIWSYSTTNVQTKIVKNHTQTFCKVIPYHKSDPGYPSQGIGTDTIYSQEVCPIDWRKLKQHIRTVQQY